MVGYLMIIMLGLVVQRGAGIWGRRVEGVQDANRFKIDCTTLLLLMYFCISAVLSCLRSGHKTIYFTGVTWIIQLEIDSFKHHFEKHLGIEFHFILGLIEDMTL